MKYILTSLLLFITCQTVFGQTVLCDAVIYWKYDGVIKIYDEPNGTQQISLKNDIENENFASLKIVEIRDKFYAVALSLDGITHYGWIEKGIYIGAFMKNEKEYMDLTFYSKPNDKLSEVIEIKNWKASFVTIEECGPEWTKVSVDYNGKRITGWIESAKLCANNYSTCS
ncbi:hypothetical protein FEE95_21875 [Maribacter algarum]|uniref:SH3 domain-containing protein n=1 Tax=Maribacter algarum (ex Zhang et al. 2020) TaxID=2578118 RepID=A0A5S3PCM8_9FLAO|nr:hypothetical protein [Maribacter algarum]TMM51450.1 hypothetical protein FEE95_21875 [Maribacter algarum]